MVGAALWHRHAADTIESLQAEVEAGSKQRLKLVGQLADSEAEVERLRKAATFAIERVESMGVPKLAYRELAEALDG